MFRTAEGAEDASVGARRPAGRPRRPYARSGGGTDAHSMNSVVSNTSVRSVLKAFGGETPAAGVARYRFFAAKWSRTTSGISITYIMRAWMFGSDRFAC